MFSTATIGMTGALLAVILLIEVAAIVYLVMAHRRAQAAPDEPRLVLVFSADDTRAETLRTQEAR